MGCMLRASWSIAFEQASTVTTHRPLALSSACLGMLPRSMLRALAVMNLLERHSEWTVCPWSVTDPPRNHVPGQNSEQQLLCLTLPTLCFQQMPSLTPSSWLPGLYHSALHKCSHTVEPAYCQRRAQLVNVQHVEFANPFFRYNLLTKDWTRQGNFPAISREHFCSSSYQVWNR